MDIHIQVYLRCCYFPTMSGFALSALGIKGGWAPTSTSNVWKESLVSFSAGGFYEMVSNQFHFHLPALLVSVTGGKRMHRLTEESMCDNESTKIWGSFITVAHPGQPQWIITYNTYLTYTWSFSLKIGEITIFQSRSTHTYISNSKQQGDTHP